MLSEVLSQPKYSYLVIVKVSGPSENMEDFIFHSYICRGPYHNANGITQEKQSHSA